MHTVNITDNNSSMRKNPPTVAQSSPKYICAYKTTTMLLDNDVACSTAVPQRRC